ncbi:Rieske 2Fe-2S domain-containing protein [Streptomyces meridianus]|uniref:Rieske (2Fe-2S) protein n=1 Tax=Streptomyces meridianus TaxID=2938945 RepID=A0ABT0XC79_9ACTN|nr:Rieske (2Fe-2S) protein [Streptomyces meridianus]MCM2580132.1 Rieske (2Fe-2S) protein [Streptomyces meridianus]
MPLPLTLLSRLERAEVLDRVAGPLAAAVRALPLGAARDVLHGRPVGHALHPTLVQIPVGSWFGAAVLDLTGRHRRAARLLVAIGLAGAAPAALSGAVDFAEQLPEQQRVGAVHDAAVATGVVLYSLSLVARCRGRDGRLLGFAGLTAVGVGGFLGGHLAYRQGAGVNHADVIGHLVPAGWHTVGALEEFPPGRPVRKLIGDVAVLLVREGESAEGLRALADRCSHLRGPLSEGEVHEGCVTCPWHGSTFRLSDGVRVSGPATADQPVFEVRVVDGAVQVRRPGD